MPLQIPFDTTYLALPERFYSRQNPVIPPAPELIIFNHELAQSLGINSQTADETELAKLFSGAELPGGATPFSQVYAGHQFGGFSPRLGDGRAVHLGEISALQGRVDIQLKGAGQTPYSRGGDGRAWLGPVLREYLMSAAMQALNIPTTRALAATLTGETIYREQGALRGQVPGAVLTRVAASHIRVGTFQYFAAKGDIEGLESLTKYTIDRHAPWAQTPYDLLQSVITKQAELVAKWMSVGFIHGVMNTDNVTLSGETIDYGPCAFMDRYHPSTVFSAIDRNGRYAYANQPAITHWNLAQLATSLVPLLPDQDEAIKKFTDQINTFPQLYEEAWSAAFAAKLGLPSSAKATALAQRLLQQMAEADADFTNTFARLEQTEKTFPGWFKEWRRAEPDDALWQRTNPQVIPRTHQIENVISAALNKDFAPFHTFLAAITQPFAFNPTYAAPPQPSEQVHQTFCGT